MRPDSYYHEIQFEIDDDGDVSMIQGNQRITAPSPRIPAVTDRWNQFNQDRVRFAQRKAERERAERGEAPASGTEAAPNITTDGQSESDRRER